MQLETFSQRVEDLKQRVTDLQNHAISQPEQREILLESAFMEFSNSLEELTVAEEELRVQGEALEESHAEVQGWRNYYEDLFESAPDAYLVSDLRGTVYEANHAAGRLFGLDARRLIGQKMSGFVPEEDQVQFLELLSGLVQERHVREHELRIQPRHGAARYVALTAGLTKPRSDEPTHLRWLVRDVSLRRAAEADRYQRLVAEIRDYAIILIDVQGQILSWNLGAEMILGSSEVEMIGKSSDLIYTPEDRASDVPNQERRIAAQSGRALDERWHMRQDGTRFWGSGVQVALRDSEGTLRWYAKIMRDLTSEHRAQERMKKDLTREHRIAETFQRAQLPEVAVDQFAGLKVATLYEAAWQEAQVGGDFYDAYRLDGNRVALAVGDVSGKGLGAAIRAGEIRTALRTVLREHSDPGAAMVRLNAFVCDGQKLDGDEEHLFATLTLVVLNPASGEMLCTLAGADPPLLFRRNQQPEMPQGGSMMLGVVPDQSFPTTRHLLEPGDRVLLVTDGITEARRGKEFLDAEGVLNLAQESFALPPQEMCRASLEGARAFAGGSLADDACLLVAERL